MNTTAPKSQSVRTHPVTDLVRRFRAYRDRRTWQYWERRLGWIDEVWNAPTVQESWIEAGTH